jgi:multidrug efflux pump subunit AcrB
LSAGDSLLVNVPVHPLRKRTADCEISSRINVALPCYTPDTTVTDGAVRYHQWGRHTIRLAVLAPLNQELVQAEAARTVDVVRRVKEALNVARASAPPGMKIKELFDQSVFVNAAIDSVLREGAIAAGLTALMILLFLGSWRSTLVVMISIPLAVLSSLIVLYFLGDTLNTMTLGGLALAVGILVDDSTVRSKTPTAC